MTQLLFCYTSTIGLQLQAMRMSSANENIRASHPLQYHHPSPSYTHIHIHTHTHSLTHIHVSFTHLCGWWAKVMLRIVTVSDVAITDVFVTTHYTAARRCLSTLLTQCTVCAERCVHLTMWWHCHRFHTHIHLHITNSHIHIHTRTHTKY